MKIEIEIDEYAKTCLILENSMKVSVKKEDWKVGMPVEDLNIGDTASVLITFDSLKRKMQQQFSKKTNINTI